MVRGARAGGSGSRKKAAAVLATAALTRVGPGLGAKGLGCGALELSCAPLAAGGKWFWSLALLVLERAFLGLAQGVVRVRVRVQCEVWKPGVRRWL